MSDVQQINVTKEQPINAPVNLVWESLLEEMGPGGILPDGTPMQTKIEPWPGGRWYRDLGENAGHFWGHVQVIKPPKLLEISGPMFMSYPAINHLQYRLIDEGDRTVLKLTHRAIGLIDPEHAKGVQEGWQKKLAAVAKIAERRMAAAKKKV